MSALDTKTHTIVKNLLLEDAPLTREAVEVAMNGTTPYTVYASLLTLRHTVNQTVTKITEPHNKRIVENETLLDKYEQQYIYLKSNPWWKRVWLALINNYTVG